MMQNDRPEWVSTTPQHIYRLVCFGDDGDAAQTIDVTIEEYDVLKSRLAELRGIRTDMEAK